MSTRVKIESDGTPSGTYVVNHDGVAIENITSVTTYMDSNSVASATIEIILPVVTVEAEVEQIEFTCPCCDKVFTHYCDPQPRTLSGK